MRPACLGRLVLPMIVLAVISGCATPPRPLYLWGSFPRQQYEALLGDKSSPQQQIQVMEEHALKARGAGTSLPPGFRAHLGMLKLNQGDPVSAQVLWNDEKEAFPEAAPYMDSLLAKLTPKKGAQQ